VGIFSLIFISIILTGAVIGIPASIIFWYLKGVPFAGVTIGLIFGVATTLLGLSRHIRVIKRLGLDNLPDALDTSHKREVSLALAFDIAFKACRNSLNLADKVKIEQEDLKGGNLIAAIQGTFTSSILKNGTFYFKAPKKIVFHLSKVTENNTKVEIFIKPTRLVPFLDLGEGLQIIETIKFFLLAYPQVEETSKVLSSDSLRQGRTIEGGEAVSSESDTIVAVCAFFAAAGFVFSLVYSLGLLFAASFALLCVLFAFSYFSLFKPLAKESYGWQRFFMFTGFQYLQMVVFRILLFSLGLIIISIIFLLLSL
jgi:hypothetical protein